MSEQVTHDIEIMAPAGSYESLMAAIKGGANSIYFGVEQLNMRAKSSNNFTLDDLRKIAEICDENGLKSYITLNTILYDHDMNLMRSVVDAAKKSGISAIIASDHSVMNYARKIGFPIHISTQANISNIETVEFYAAYADVMVMARELSLMQVAEITREIKKEKLQVLRANWSEWKYLLMEHFVWLFRVSATSVCTQTSPQQTGVPACKTVEENIPSKTKWQ